MARRQASFFIVLFFISQLFRDNASQQRGAGGELYSIYQMMLKGHTYKSFKTAPGTPECREACLADVRCQRYSVVMFIAICQLTTELKRSDQRTLSRTRTDTTWRKVQNEVIENAKIKKQYYI